MNPSPKNDFTGYNEAHALVEAGIENCNDCTGNTKEERAGWLIPYLRRAETILTRYGLDDGWCTRHKKPKLREIIKSYLTEDFKFNETQIKAVMPQLYEPFLLDAEPVKRKKARKSLVTERGTNYLSLDEGRGEIETTEVHVDIESMLIFDCIAQVVRNTLSNFVVPKEEIASLISLPAAERQEVLAKMPAITFTDDDVRKMTGLKKLPGWYIESLCRKVKMTLVVLSKKIFWADGHWHGFDILSSFGDVQIDKDGVTIRRADIPEAHQIKHRYTICLNTVLGAIFLSNISQGKYRLLPLSFYKLSLPRQTLYRAYVALQGRGRTVDLAYSRICRLIGEPEKARNLKRQISKFERHFKALEPKMNITCKTVGKARKTVFKLSKSNAAVSLLRSE
jgi:hypothetical protein